MRASGYRPSVRSSDTSRTSTKAIWDRIPWDQIQAGQREGWVFWDDFINMPNLSADADLHKYAAYIDVGATIKQSSASEHGELEITTPATDNFEAWIQTGGNTGGLAKFIAPATGKPHLVAIEFRLKLSSIATVDSFVGFGAPGLAAADTITDADGLANKDFLGFQITNSGLDFTWKKLGSTQQVIVSNADLLVANTFVKAGLIYDYRNRGTQLIEVYNDGVLNGGFGTKTQIEDATFPDSKIMAILMGVKNAAAGSRILNIDWVKAALVVM